MISLLLFALLAPQPTGSISGLVKDSESGNPLTEVEVRAAPGGATAKTDAEGRYTIKDLAPRTYRVTAAASLDGHPGFGASATKTVHLTSARDLTSIDFSLRAMGEISGRVLDEEKEPLPDISVFLVTREYGLGTLRYVFSGMARTDDQGRYRLKRVIPGQGFLVTAQKRTLKLDPVSDVPSDPKLRKRAWVPGYYPDSPSIEGAQLLVLRPGEKREAIDLRLSRSPSYCIEGVLATGTGPAALKFELEQRRPTSGASGDGGFYTVAPGGTTGPDGKLRLCNLYPGDFTITAMQAPGFFGTTPVSITDSDVGNVRITARPKVPVSGEVVFDGAPPDNPVTAKLTLWLRPLARGQWMGEELQVRAGAPDKFSFPGLFVDDYDLMVMGVPEGTYVKDITYGGVSIRHQPFRVGTAMGDSSLRVLLARDGAVLTARVADKEATAIPDSWVYAIPAAATTEAEIAGRLISGQTGQDGVFSSKALAPGKYYLIAGTVAINKTPESIAKLAAFRSQATEIDLSPGATQSITLLPKIVE